MSFILDALKKSETDRQRQSGPAVFEMKVAARKPGLPGWVWGLAGLLAINLGVVAWLMLRHPSRSDAQGTQAPQMAPAPTPAATPAPAPMPAPTQTAAASQPDPHSAPAPAPAPADEESNSEDYEPAAEPAAAPVAPPQASTTSAVGLPDYTQVVGTAAAKGMPDLRLDLHVYAVKPAERFVFINMHRLHEGESLPEGVRVESIVNDGAILSWRGTKFLLDRE